MAEKIEEQETCSARGCERPVDAESAPIRACKGHPSGGVRRQGGTRGVGARSKDPCVVGGSHPAYRQRRAHRGHAGGARPGRREPRTSTSRIGAAEAAL